MTPTRERILELLRSTAGHDPDGWTACDLAESIGRHRETVLASLRELRADGLISRTWDHRGEFDARPSSLRFVYRLRSPQKPEV